MKIIQTSIRYPDKNKDSEYPKMLNTKIDTEDEIGRYFLGTIETSIPVHDGNSDAPKNKINHKQIIKNTKFVINEPMVANIPANTPVNKHILNDITLCLFPI